MSFLGAFLLLVGLILAAVGTILVVVHRNNGERQWWMWALVVGGVILFILGLALWIYNYEWATSTVEVSHVETPTSVQTSRQVTINTPHP